jgi:hypothetical protein
MAAECAEFHSKAGDLKMFGFAILDQSFYCIKIPGTTDTQKAACIIQVLQGEATKKKIEDELRNLFNCQWDWHVRQVDGKEFTAVFPDKASLEIVSKMFELLLSIHGLKVKIFRSDVDHEASEILQTTWVKIYSLLRFACKEEIVVKVASLAGDPILVDELSLIKTGPVRVKINCTNLTTLRGFVRIFFNMIGYQIRFVFEKYKEKNSTPPPPPPNSRFDEDGEEREEDSDDDNDRKHRKVQGKKTRKSLDMIEIPGSSGGRIGPSLAMIAWMWWMGVKKE